VVALEVDRLVLQLGRRPEPLVVPWVEDLEVVHQQVRQVADPSVDLHRELHSAGLVVGLLVEVLAVGLEGLQR
jgi:hypothetical protein